MALMEMFRQIDEALSDLAAKKETLEAAQTDYDRVEAAADAQYKSTLAKAKADHDETVGTAAEALNNASTEYNAQLKVSQDLKAQFDASFSGLSASNARVRVS